MKILILTCLAIAAFGAGYAGYTSRVNTITNVAYPFFIFAGLVLGLMAGMQLADKWENRRISR